MRPRLRLVLTAVTLCAVAAVAGVLVADGRRSRSAEAQAGGGSFAGALRPQGARAPELAGLRDQDGRPLPMTDLRGRPVVMTFVYSTCRDTCPTLVQTIRGALDRLGRDVPVVGVSVDPGNDTPALARRFLLDQHMTGRMRFALGTRDRLEPVWRAYGIAPQRRAMEHTAYIVLLDDRGLQRIGWPAGHVTSEGLEHDLRLLLAGA